MFERVDYRKLSAKQQEIYNYQWVSGLLGTYGFHTHLIPDDWEGADFIARHMLTGKQLSVQLKGRVYFAKKYFGKQIWICFRHDKSAYLYPHDQLLEAYLKRNPMTNNQAWQMGGEAHWKTPTAAHRQLLEPFRLEAKI